MSKDIEQIIDDFVVPEMEYEPKYDKKRSKKREPVTVSIDAVPEVVLPKTKAEVYEEAKGRLKQKSAAVSGRTRTGARTSTAAAPERETAATASPRRRRTVTKEPQSGTLVAEPIWVGTAEELIPFAWRNPLLADIKKPNKLYRSAIKNAREQRLPAPRNN